MITIKQDGYADVYVDQSPLPCPFCGSAAKLAQLEHAGTGKKRVCIIASSRVQHADTFWFKCESCKATSGGHHGSAQKAVEAWNRRQEP